MSENESKPQQTATASERGPNPSVARGGVQPGAVDWSKPRVLSILKAAVRCFARSGFDTTTAEIAAEIGIPKSVIYHYFDDKVTLVREAQRFAYAEHLERLKQALSTVGDLSGQAVVDRLRHLWKVPDTRNIAFELGIWSELRNDEKVRDQAVELRKEHHRLVATGVAKALGIDTADPSRTEPLSTLIVAALTGLSLNASLEEDETNAAAAHEVFMDLLEKGIERFAKRPDSDLPAPGLESDLPPPYDSIGPRSPIRDGY
jgi:AcrR family transcriptional regulator